MILQRLFGHILLVVILWSITNFINVQNTNDAGNQPAITGENAPKVNFQGPAISLKGLDGELYSLENIKGKPVVVNFWASWCPPCREEAPDLVNSYNRYEGELEIFAVNLTNQDTVERAQAFSDEFGFQFPVLLDDNGVASGSYQVLAVPTTFFLNKEGVIVDQIIGYGGSDLLIEKIEKLVTQSR